MKILIISCLVILQSTIIAQNYSASQIDSVFTRYLQIKAPHLITDVSIPQREDTLISKCGLGIVNFVRMNIMLFSESQQAVINSVLQRTPKQTSVVTPGGFFRVHYNTTGNDIPGYNINDLLTALDSVYNFEVNYLGYPAPPPDNAGGDNLYDVYINQLGSSLYGYTEFETELTPGSGKWTSFMVIDNDYIGSFATTGINGARVTVAHEFHHAIQGGNYIYGGRDSDLFFYELSSTAMEEFVYDSINDYYAYMNNYFTNPGRSFSANNGYNLAIWNIFLKERFGFDILKRQWELMPQMRALSSISNSLEERSASMRTEFNKFGVWTYFTKSRRIPGMYFEEAQFYPLIKTGTPITFMPPVDTVGGSSSPVANNFFTLLNQSPNPADTLVVLISNSDITRGNSAPNSVAQFNYTLSVDSLFGSIKLAQGYYAFFNQSDPGKWAVSEFLNGQLVREDSSIVIIPKFTEEFVFPNPFVYGKAGHENIYFTVAGNVGDEVDLNIYTPAMELVYASEGLLNTYGGLKVISWNGFNDKNKKVGSGVYIYAIKKGNDISKGKLVILND